MVVLTVRRPPIAIELKGGASERPSKGVESEADDLSGVEA